MKKIWLALLVLAGLVIFGCATYYQVKDPVSGRIYYTNNLDRQKGGAVEMEDATTREKVTVQNSEIREITKEEFESKRRKYRQPLPPLQGIPEGASQQ